MTEGYTDELEQIVKEDIVIAMAREIFMRLIVPTGQDELYKLASPETCFKMAELWYEGQKKYAAGRNADEEIALEEMAEK